MKRRGSHAGGSAEKVLALDAAASLWEDTNSLTFTPLGSGQEVGRSCHILEFKGKKIMLDCGIHPGRTYMNMLPFFDTFEMSQIDMLLITHHHLDHAASMPYLTERTGFRGQIYMTRCTYQLLRLVLKDYARIMASDTNEPIFTAAELGKCLDKVQVVNFHQQIEVEGIKLTPYHAGHVLGACMFLIEIADVKILYTGDYSREDDRHLRGAEIPSIRPDVLIVEATFGLLVHERREDREKRFTETVERIVRRGGNCLIPMGALGAVQELLLILEDHWNRNPDLKGIPIYHTSRMANEALDIYRSFINDMNESIKTIADPWSFDNIDSLGEKEEIVGPAVVLASPGYLQSGKSRKLFEQWCSDRRNGCILAGYSVEGTLAKQLSQEGAVKHEIVSMQGTLLQVECEVKNISFAAHSDFIGTKSFVDALRPKNIIFVHGEAQQMHKLRSKLQHDAHQLGQETEFFSPENCKSVVLRFQEQRIVKAYGGELVQERMRGKGNRIATYLVRKDLQDRLIATEDVRLYTQLKTAVVKQKMHLHFHPKFEALTQIISRVFQPRIVSENTITVDGKVELVLKNSVVSISWDGSPSTDMIADALIAIIMQADGGITAVRIGSCCSAHCHSAMPAPKPKVAAEPAKMDAALGHSGDTHSSQAAEEVAKQDVVEAIQGADVSQVVQKSYTADVFLRLLEEKYGKSEIELLPNSVRVIATRDSSGQPVLTAELAFSKEGHVSALRASAEDENLEADLRNLARLAALTVHSVM